MCVDFPNEKNKYCDGFHANTMRNQLCPIVSHPPNKKPTHTSRDP